ncbi:unnamed protein product [Schistocephalus solidus]|uniref:Transmembrane protein n=1 Tax=Schistocephalus solidus TaxID=70667 RepID=A0A183S957_SCHSO|nr:unnamed protein product [Schistocephalus solidus]
MCLLSSVEMVLTKHVTKCSAAVNGLCIVTAKFSFTLVDFKFSFGLAVILGVPLVLIYVYIFMPISLFPTRRSQNTESKPPIDPDIGHTVNWDLVAENTAHNSRSKNNSSRSSSSSKEFIEAVAKTQDASPSRRASASSQSSADDIQGHLLRSGVDASKKRAQSNGKFT